MNKLIAMLVVAIATVSQAASFNWSASAGTAYEGYSVYLAKSSTYATLAALQNDLIGTSDNYGTLAKASATARSVGASGSAKGLAVDTSYDFYYVFVNGDDFWVSAKQSFTTAASESATPPSVSFSQASGTALLSGAPTGSFAVPEPTSGILLLLGIAGLALKRKRA